ncbi:hypothetical protein AMJ82_00300 [candidate division TA06 bacterium SM23_40]|uniref:NYN domain-containing protein n=1 Tax=candidate division TA06 bacterium SM23_40 TaxID=1703774 RepID=A0A0S8GEU7_UNCT6|nr:MAG: hypothetical protein AMJ82_00300 [candidate division TA06 bacterium SM23_40]
MSTHVVIDGYNLIFSDPAFAEIAERNLQQARDELVRLLSAYRTRSGSDITVVFHRRLRRCQRGPSSGEDGASLRDHGGLLGGRGEG